HGGWEEREAPNFGNFITDISGYKWNDLDRDGVWDPGERGLNGWTIYLDMDGNDKLGVGEPSFVTRYDGEHDGAFWFVDRPAGTYTVREVPAEGWKQSYPAQSVPTVFEHQVSISPATEQRAHGGWEEREAPNFGNFITDISGYKWDDCNRDGVWDPDELGLNGWTIYLDTDGNGKLGVNEKSFLTRFDGEHDGAFWFVDLPAGAYTVREVLKEGWKQGYPAESVPTAFEHSLSIDPPAGQRVHGGWQAREAPNFGNYLTDLSGYKWDDRNRDGVWDAGEPGLNGWTIYLDLDNDNQLSPAEPSFVTRSDGEHDGAFWFADLPAGRYTVREVLQNGWKQSYPAEAVPPAYEHLVTIDPAGGVRAHGAWQNRQPPNFGNYLTDLSGYKWDDRNRDGIWDAGEPGLNGWTIYLDTDGNDKLGPTEPSFITRFDGVHDGAFWFADLPAGPYSVREILKEGWKQSYPAESVPSVFEHQVTVDPAAGVRVHGGWQQRQSPNFGNFITDISGYKWDDRDRDGAWDEGEPGLNGWMIYLDLDNDNQRSPAEPSFMTRNDGEHDGAFWFAGLTQGAAYAVREVLPEGWKNSFPGSAEHNVVIPTRGRFGRTELPNFGNFITDISGYKWNDQDRDGVWDPGEPGLNGWTIYLDLDNNNTLSAGDPSFVTRNDGQHDGAFWFAGLAAGTYTVREVLEEGWKQSYPAQTILPPFEHQVAINPSAGQRVHGGWQQRQSPNFGNYIADISGYKWDDRDRDGVWDPGEPGLNGWTFYLDLNNDNALSAGDPSFVTRNDGEHDGAFWFAGLEARAYTVREVLQEGWKQSYPAESLSPPFEHLVAVNPAAGQRVHGGWQQRQSPNFGNFITDISGYKWDDRDRDGVWDPGEPGLNGWTIYLDLNNDNKLSAADLSFVTRNDGEHDGAFWFVGLDAGSYPVREVLQEGWKQTYPAQTISPPFEHQVVINPSAGQRVHGGWQQRQSPNFGNFVTDISGYLWNDRNLDGIWDPDGADNASGTPDDETGLNDWTIYLDLNNNDRRDPTDRVFVSRNDGEHDGAFWFVGLEAGTYTVREELKEGWKQSYPGKSATPPFEHVVVIDPPNGVRVHGGWEETQAPNFGNFVTDISGYKWNDRNANGIWDPDGVDNVAGTTDDEPGLNGWTIYLDLDNQNDFDPGEPSCVTQYDGEHDGAFWFTGLAQGETYTVREVLLADWMNSFPGGAEQAVAVPTRGRLGKAEPPNFGNTVLFSVSGMKFLDAFADGVRDPDGVDNIPGNADDEVPLPGWAMRAYEDLNGNGMLDQEDIDNGVVDQDDTGADGEYELRVPAGNYIVVEVLQPDPPNGSWDQTAPTTVVNDIDFALGRLGYAVTVDKNLTGFHFGNSLVPPGNPVVSGVKFNDINGDGSRDEDGADNVQGTPDDEVGLPKWTIQAYADTNASGMLDPGEFADGVVAHDETGSDGRYRLTLPSAGDYIIVEVLQSGWRQTRPRMLVLSPGLPGEIALGQYGYALQVTLEDFVDNVDFGNQRILTKRLFLASSAGNSAAAGVVVPELSPLSATIDFRDRGILAASASSNSQAPIASATLNKTTSQTIAAFDNPTVLTNAEPSTPLVSALHVDDTLVISVARRARNIQSYQQEVNRPGLAALPESASHAMADGNRLDPAVVDRLFASQLDDLGDNAKEH
ncbi:MAG: hypothetical protein HUU20_21895, partial [Pirellulales bacterium]|nr:hypothetical protein [Pirellulales bacterium]